MSTTNNALKGTLQGQDTLRGSLLAENELSGRLSLGGLGQGKTANDRVGVLNSVVVSYDCS